MKLFIDTANVEEIKLAAELGVVCGVTTNPSLIAKEGRKLSDVIKEIVDIVDGPVSAEVNSLECMAMYDEAMKLKDIHPNIVIKIPMCVEGLKAVKLLSKKGVKTNVTLIFNPNQALLAARAGATYVSPFLGRLDDISSAGIELVSTVADIFAIHNIDCEIISASIRHPEHVVSSALAGAHIATVPYNVILQMTKHPLTDIGIDKFVEDFNNSSK